MSNIILIGFMGSGKTQVGKLLASKLGLHFIDTDDLVEKSQNTKISDIFAQKGEPYFRDLETKIIDTLMDYDKFVIATGGGMVLRQVNVDKLKKIGPLVLLSADTEAIYDRVKDNQDRPLLQGDAKDNINKILAQRNPVYRSVADFEIDTSHIGVSEVVEQIIRKLNLKTGSNGL